MNETMSKSATFDARYPTPNSGSNRLSAVAGCLKSCFPKGSLLSFVAIRQQFIAATHEVNQALCERHEIVRNGTRAAFGHLIARVMIASTSSIYPQKWTPREVNFVVFGRS
jgi:hypothetical protein